MTIIRINTCLTDFKSKTPNSIFHIFSIKLFMHTEFWSAKLLRLFSHLKQQCLRDRSVNTRMCNESAVNIDDAGHIVMHYLVLSDGKGFFVVTLVNLIIYFNYCACNMSDFSFSNLMWSLDERSKHCRTKENTILSRYI